MTTNQILSKATKLTVAITTTIIVCCFLASVAVTESMSIPSVISVSTLDTGSQMATSFDIHFGGLLALTGLVFTACLGLLTLTGRQDTAASVS